MHSLSFLFIQIAIFGVITSEISTITDNCITGPRSGFVSLEVNTWHNSSGHQNIKTDLKFSQTTNSSGKSTLEIIHYNTVENGMRMAHISSLLSVQDVRRAPPGYELVTGIGWFRFHLTPRTWEEAKAHCEKEGGHLAVLNSKEESLALKTMFNKFKDKMSNASFQGLAFVGFSDAVEGKYETIFGQTLEEAGFAIWDNGQPNNKKGDFDPDQDCGAMRITGKYSDLDCHAKQPFFCKYIHYKNTSLAVNLQVTNNQTYTTCKT